MQRNTPHIGQEVEHARLVITTLWLMVFTAASQIMIVSAILPKIAGSLDVKVSTAGSLMTIYAVAVGLFALVTGPLSDRFGRRRILIAGSGLLSIALALHGLADSFFSLMTMRGIAGAAGGILSGSAVAYVGDYFPVRKRGWANGWVMSGLAAGQIAGVPLGTLLAEPFGFRAPFLAFSGVAAITCLLIVLKLPTPNVQRSERVTVGRALRAYRELLSRGEIRAATAAFAMMFMGISLFVIFLPSWGKAQLGFDEPQIALLFAVAGVANVLAGPQAGRLSDRVGRIWVIIGASVGAGLMMPLLPLLAPGAHWLIYPLFFVLMALMAARISPFQALMTQLTQDVGRGALMSLVTAVGQLGFGLGSILSAWAYDEWSFIGNALLGSGAVFTTALVVFVFLRRSDVLTESEEASDQEERNPLSNVGVAPVEGEHYNSEN